jgi:LysM repeat protein
MKWLFALLLAVIIFGGAAWFGYNFVFKQEIEIRKEQRGEVTPAPRIDISLPEFQAAAKLRQEGKLNEARAALTAFIEKYPGGAHVEEAKDLLGEVNVDILLSRTPSPDKQEYVVRSGDVLQKIARKMKSTPELIMRMNNLSSTMLHIGDRLLISHPQFSMIIDGKPKLIVLLDHGAFFKQYHIREEKLPPRRPAKVNTRVAEVMAWKDGKRIGFGTKDYISSTRWIRLAAAIYIIEELSSLVNNRTPVTITN